MGLKIFKALRSKKGVVFTIMAITLSVFFTLLFSARFEKPIDYKTQIIETRINVLNAYLMDFFRYTESAGSISGYAGLQGILTDMNTSRRYYNRTNEFETNFTYCIKTGNLTEAKKCPDMENKTITYYLNNLNEMARDRLNINNSVYSINNITVTQAQHAFALELVINLSLNISDAFANLSKTRVVTSLVSINGLQDPLYLIKGTYSQVINQTNITKSGNWTQNDLQSLYYSHTYREYKDLGVSFINRIKGNFSPSVFGIESIVNHTAPGVNGMYGANNSLVDHLFWTKTNFSCKGNVSVVMINNSAILPGPPYIQLDEVHRLNFEISNSNTSFTCSQT
jgi:hypothetical protein